MVDHIMNSLLEGCGATGPLILGVEEPGTSGVSWRVFEQPFVIVGRDSGSDLVLQDPELSRRHAYIQMIAGRPFCVDLQSRTGTHWGDEPGLWGWVDPDAGIKVGPFRIRSRDGTPGVRPSGGTRDSIMPVPVSRSFDQGELVEVILKIAGRTSGPSTWRASRALILIGASQACKVRLFGGGVASIHAAILRTPAGAFAIDLLGPGGILVNGRRVRCARLGQDDELLVGGHEIQVHCGPSVVEAVGSSNRPTERSRMVAFSARTSIVESAKGTTLPAFAEDTESLMGTMLDEIGQLQEQNAERLQTTLIAIVQSFVGIHQDQMALVREELACIRALTEEQATLRSQVERQARAVGSPSVLRLVSGEATTATSRPAPGLAAPIKAAPLPRQLTIGGGKFGSAVEQPASLANGSPAWSASNLNESEFHDRVFERLSKIQGERQGRWQKLVESLIGKSP